MFFEQFNFSLPASVVYTFKKTHAAPRTHPYEAAGAQENTNPYV